MSILKFEPDKSTSDGGKLETIRRVLRVLLRAMAGAVEKGVSHWDFAVSLDEIRQTGIDDNEVRGWICAGVVEHAHEVRTSKSIPRTFETHGAMGFYDTSGFVLSTNKGVRLAKVLLNISDPSELLTDYAAGLLQREYPHWDAKHRELWVGGELVKRYKGRVNKQEITLAAFEDQEWPERVANPFKHASEMGLTTLGTVVQNLNRSQNVQRLWFRCKSRGKAISWERVDAC